MKFTLKPRSLTVILSARFRKYKSSRNKSLFIKTCMYIHISRMDSSTLFVFMHSPLLTVISLLLCCSPAGRITSTDTYLREARPAREPSLRQLSFGRSQGVISVSLVPFKGLFLIKERIKNSFK